MALDALKQYADDLNKATEAAIKRALKGPGGDPTPKGIKPHTNAENVLQGIIERVAAQYKEQQQNILKAGQLRSRINKATAAGDPPEELLLMALECISLMTGDPLFYKTNKAKLLNSPTSPKNAI